MPYKDPDKQRQAIQKLSKEFRARKKTKLEAEANAYIQVEMARLKDIEEKGEKEKLRKEYVERELIDFFGPILKYLTWKQKNQLYVAISKEVREGSDPSMTMSQAKKYYIEKIKEIIKG